MKSKTQYSCQSCGTTSAKWLGRCSGCGEWNTLVEERIESGGGGKGSRLVSGMSRSTTHKAWVDVSAPESDETSATRGARIPTGSGELDRVLGGGLVPDSFVLLGGDPGIGKSTLLLQMCQGVATRNEGLQILYVSGEESVEQIRSRARRLGVDRSGQILITAETRLEEVLATVEELRPQVLVMDSLQTFASDLLESAPGSVSQVREIALKLMHVAKGKGVAVWLVGHVTKDGAIAGPKVIEHMVDTVLYFEGDSSLNYRLLRTVKNRFGSSRELGVFEMEGDGLREVTNPSSLFLSDREGTVSGTAVGTSLEGSRPLLVEVQALVASSALAVPRRTAVGMDSSRIALIAAILERHMKLPLAQYDLFFNVAGGLRLSEPACDLAAAAAIWSSASERPLPREWIWLGELGLTGEVRRVSQLGARLEEAKRLGFTTAVIPQAAVKGSSLPDHLKTISISRIEDLRRIVAE